MLRFEEVALELFEYKVSEIRNRRPTRGGLSHVWQLHEHLKRQTSQLTLDELRRLEAAERVLLRLAEPAAEAPAKSPLSIDDLVLADDSTPPEAPPTPGKPVAHPPARAGGGGAAVAVAGGEAAELAVEGEALRRLAARVWRHRHDDFVARAGAALRAERDLYTARLLYSLLRNLDVWRDRCRRSGEAPFTVDTPIPALDDPLFSAHDLHSLREVVSETIAWVTRLADGGDGLPPGEPGKALGRLHALAMAVAENPYAGRSGLFDQRGPSARQLRVAIQELGKERLSPDELIRQRRDLEARLATALAFERQQRQQLVRDVERFTALVAAFFDRLRPVLPRRLGGSGEEPRLPGGVLFARNPALALGSVDDDSLTVTMRVVGPSRLTLAGTGIMVRPSGGELILFAGGGEHRVGEDGLHLRLDERRLHAFREGQYLHLALEDDTQMLPSRLARAVAAAKLLTLADRDALRASVAVMAQLPAETDPLNLVTAALNNVSRQLRSAPRRDVALAGFLTAAAKLARVELPGAAAAEFARRLLPALRTGEADPGVLINAAGLQHASVHTLTAEPLALEMASFNLTIRSYDGVRGRDSLVVMLAGQVLGTIDEGLVEPLGEGVLVCARGDHQLVAGYLGRDPVTDSSGT